MDEDIEDLTIPFINIKSIVEEREIHHEEELQKAVLELVEAMSFKSNIEQALDEGKEEVVIDFPKYFQKPLSEIFVGKIRFRDVFQNFAALMAKEAYPFEFESSFFGGCCPHPSPAWDEDSKESWNYDYAVWTQYGCCYHCKKALYLGDNGWKLLTRGTEADDDWYTKSDCCKFMREINKDSQTFNGPGFEEGILLNEPFCFNCYRPFKAIPYESKKPDNTLITKLKIKLR
jgi:hypothetical protein